MGRKVQKETLYMMLFAMCVAVPYINIYEITFVLWGLVILLTIRKKYALHFIHYLLYFLAILGIAVVSACFRDYLKTYAVLRDITYLLKPFLGLLLGYQLCAPYLKKPLEVVVNTAAIIAVLHLVIIINAYVVFHIRTMNELREYGGYFSDFEIYALILLIFHKKFELGYSQKKVWILMALIGVSSFLYLARTNFIQLVILWLAIKGYFVVNRRSIIVFGSLFLVAAIGYTFIYNSNPRRGAHGLEALMYKIRNAPIEPFKTKVNKDNWRDFNDNYRSYENIQTVLQVSNHGWESVIFGRGLGSTIDLKTEVWLQTSRMRYIPFLHNGFMTVFLKSGVLGVAIYLCTIIFFFAQRRSNDPLIQNINLIFLGTGFFLFISNWVFVGFYNLFDTKTILIGFLIAYKQRLDKQNIS